MKKIDFENYQWIACIPVKNLSHAPEDQSPCTQEVCKYCNELMWVSENKKKLLNSGKAYDIACFRCLIKDSISQGFDLELFDFTKFN